MAFASSQAMAGTLNISGVVKTFGTTRTTSSAYIETTKNVAFNNKTIYLALSNAIAGFDAPAGLATHLPKDGIIGFNPNGYDGNVDGYFYVTNAPGKPFFFFALSGYDTNDDYYSYMELDTRVAFSSLGFASGLFNETISEVETRAATSLTSSSKALLYIHDNPYEYDDSSVPSRFEDNDLLEIEIGGVLTMKANENGTTAKATFSGSLRGTGNAIIDEEDGVVTSGTASFSTSFLDL